MTEMTGSTTKNLSRSIHKSTPGYDNGPIVDGAAVQACSIPISNHERSARLALGQPT